MTDEELKNLVASLAITQQETNKGIAELRLSQQETDRQIGELRLSQQETDKQIGELRLSQQETDRQLRVQLTELKKQIGGLGEKFGSFTEGMAFPAMTKILTQQLGMEAITTRFRIKKNGDSLELDVFAYANTTRNEAYIVEVKSHLRAEGIEQLRKIMEKFRKLVPEHNDKKLYGILAVVDLPDKLRQEVFDNGFYLALIHDDQFILDTPPEFIPKCW